MTFLRGTDQFKKDVSKDGGLGVAYHLPPEEKERLCRSLLAEFGVTHVKVGGRGELIHGCILPFGNHTDQDRNPTASLNFEKLVYHCFGCASGGSILWFVGLMRDISGTEARRWLVQQTGLGEDQESLSVLLEYFDAVYSKDRGMPETPMPKMDKKILKPWELIHPYMTEDRGIPEDVLIRFNVGYGLIRHRGIDSHRIIIPHFWEGDLVGWQSRRLVDDGTPKYLASPDFPKDRTLYNYRRRADEAVIVESPISVLSKDHVSHLEATFGAQVTDKQRRLISMHSKITLFFDNDEAGYTATHQMGEFLMRYCDVYVAKNPWNGDPADMTDGEYVDCIRGAVSYALWNSPTELMELDREDVIASA